MKTFIVLIPVENNRDARHQCENIENITLNFEGSLQPSAMSVRKVLERDYLSDADAFEVETISDFMDRVNDEEFNVDAYFMSYIYA